MRTPSYHQPDLTDPAMAQTRPGSIFTPAIAAWSSPGALGALPGGAMTPYLLIAAAVAAAYFRKIPWWAAAVASGGVWFTMLRSGGVIVTNGQGILSSGQTIQFTSASPATITNDTAQFPTLTVGGVAYSVLRAETNTDGSVTYYLDTP
jgi:hypothetical protein